MAKDFKIVHALRENSGWGWDEGIQKVRATQEQWEDYLKVCHFSFLFMVQQAIDTIVQAHPYAAKFRKCSFPIYDELLGLLEGKTATGEFAFHAGESSLLGKEGEVSYSLSPMGASNGADASMYAGHGIPPFDQWRWKASSLAISLAT
jgi:hypothetical protein